MDMQWHLLSQFFVSTDSINSVMCVFEEVVSSELQLAQVLVSGKVSSETINSLNPEVQWYNQAEVIKLGAPI